MIAMLIPATTLSAAVTASSTALGAAMDPLDARQEIVWCLVASVPCYVMQGIAPVATATSMYVPAGVLIYLSASNGPDVAVLRAAGDGVATLTRCRLW